MCARCREIEVRKKLNTARADSAEGVVVVRIVGAVHQDVERGVGVVV